MIIHSPCLITARLMAGIEIGDGTISIEYGKTVDRHGRHNYHYCIDFPEGEYEGEDLSGLGGLQDGLCNLLSFLSAAADAYRYEMSGRESDNGDIFPPAVMEWAYRNSDAIEMAEIDLEEEFNLIKE